MSHTLHRALAACLAATFLATVHGSAGAQTRAGASPLRGVPAVPAPDRPVVLYTAEQPRIRVVPVATGLDHPWGMAFRQNGDILVTERDRGALRVIRNGQLLDEDVPGVPEVYDGVLLAGLMDVTVHPEDDTLVYLTYSQERERDGRRGATVALARGRLDAGAGALTEVRDIFVADGWGGGIAASRLQWGPDGTLYMSVGGAFQFAQTGHYAQDGSTHFGKLLRLNDDGSAPDDNPFVGDPDHLPEIYSLGHRNQIGLAFHPDTGELWATEHGPQGGDEANIIRPGANYGWPVASYSRQYSGLPVTDTPWLPEFTGPEVIWWPSIGPSGLTFYDGEHFPAWRGNLFVGSMTVGRMPNTGHLERIVFNRRGQEIRREWLLTELKQRVREVQQGPDGYLYVLTEEDDGVLLRIEPARAITEAPGSIVPAVRLTEARVPPLAEGDWTADQRAFVERYEAEGHSANVVRTLARVPALGDRVLPFNRYIAAESTLSPRHRAILILRAAWLAQSGNIWATHASRAAEAGLTADEVLGIAMGFDLSSERDPFEETLLGLADQLFRNAAVTDRTWEELSARYGTEEMLDAVMTVGDTLSAAILVNTLGIQPDAAATALMPTEDVGYSINVPDAEPPLAEPRVEPLEGDGLRVTRTFLRNPAMSAARNQNERYILEPERSRLTPHDRELVILRMGWNSGAVYEWAKHVGSVGRARDHGLEPLWIAQGRDQTGWNARELALIDAANEMFRDSMISDETWEDLAAEYDTHQLMSIAATAGRYRMVSLALNALGVQPLPTDERFPVLEGY
ncbi:MAG: PQQ-dependent sugar dehydrogenase [Acidobacteria bacterium]|nr:PQQ-dependent sugar dehydrogenase [Acidobacteriota bacterium]